MLLNSIIINIDVSSIEWKTPEKREHVFSDKPYITFLELFVDKSKYINYNYVSDMIRDQYGNLKTLGEQQKNQELYNFLLKTIKRLETDSKYFGYWYKRNQEANTILHKLNNSAIYEYIIECIRQNAKIIGNRMVPL
jgi:hypothetical protein